MKEKSQSFFSVSNSLLSVDLITRGFLMAPVFPSSVHCSRADNLPWFDLSSRAKFSLVVKSFPRRLHICCLTLWTCVWLCCMWTSWVFWRYFHQCCPTAASFLLPLIPSALHAFGGSPSLFSIGGKSDLQLWNFGNLVAFVLTMGEVVPGGMVAMDAAATLFSSSGVLLAVRNSAFLLLWWLLTSLGSFTWCSRSSFCFQEIIIPGLLHFSMPPWQTFPKESTT